jgi:hypothetical protein
MTDGGGGGGSGWSLLQLPSPVMVMKDMKK